MASALHRAGVPRSQRYPVRGAASPQGHHPPESIVPLCGDDRVKIASGSLYINRMVWVRWFPRCPMRRVYLATASDRAPRPDPVGATHCVCVTTVHHYASLSRC